jgi:hypothetical protein
MFKRYKEIWFGALLGAGMWLMDVWMHVELGDAVHSHDFYSEIFQPHPTAVLFRAVYFAIAVAFGIFLWRANWRERELRQFEAAILAFQRQLDRPALRILAHVRQLQNRNSVQLDEAARILTNDIGEDARLLEELARKYHVFSEQVRSGNTAQAAETLQAIEAWLNSQNTRAKS